MNNWIYRRHQRDVDHTLLRNTVAVRMDGNTPVVRVYINNDTEDPKETLSKSEHYRYFSEKHGGPYPHVEFKHAKGFPLSFQKTFK